MARLITGAVAENGGNPLVAGLANDSRSWALDVPAVTAAPATPPMQMGTPARVAPAAGPIAFDWVTIPAGEFPMGSDKEKSGQAYADETPQHTVYLPEYRIARVPVTVAQFADFVKASPGYQDRGRAAVHAVGLRWVENGMRSKAPTGRTPGPAMMWSKQEITLSPAFLAATPWRFAMGRCAVAHRSGMGEARGADGRIWPWGSREPNERTVQLQL